MRIAIASGKGGTGKTTVATNLAYVAAQAGCEVDYVDCDVEEPNGHLFLKPAFQEERVVSKLVPRVDAQRCAACGECARFCQFHALACVRSKVLVYPELCHACGGCRWVCPQDAIDEERQEIGRVRNGHAGRIRFVEGRLRVGEAQSPPVIRAAKEAAPKAELVLFDAPPGTACPVVETVRGSDFVVLVTEPTPFGIHDLRLALDMARCMNLRCGLVINRAMVGRTGARTLGQKARIPLLAEIPDDLAIAEAYSDGKLAVEAVPGLRRTFAQLLLRLASAAASAGGLPDKVRANLEQIVDRPAISTPLVSRRPSSGPPPVCFLSLRMRKAKADRVPINPTADQ
ncbi:MAG: ATP-binding protein [Candidatus Omnitrophica bacterium]|nr:ATP-binding protein [Candidatus Omnitrophota bacterium]